MRLGRKAKVEYVEIEAPLTSKERADHVDFLCQRAAGHFAMQAAEAKAASEDERAKAFEEARSYFLPQAVIVGPDGKFRPVDPPSVGEKNWAERNGLS